MALFKSSAQHALKWLHLYERAKASPIYDLFWAVADKRVLEQKESEVQFYKGLLAGFRKGDLVFDIGANQGAKTETFLRLGARVVAADPDPSNQTILAERFLKYRIAKKPVSIVEKAVSDKDGFETFWMDEPGSAKNTLNQKWAEVLRNDPDRFGKALQFRDSIRVETVRLETLIGVYGRPFFVKIDTEGHERNVLDGLEQPVPYLSFEVNLPEFRNEGLRCLDRLKQIAPNGEFNYSIDSQTRLALEDWVSGQEFQQILVNCQDNSIEVFWKTMARET